MATLNASTLSRLSDLVDMLGGINAEISLLERQAQAIKAELSAAGVPVIEGSMYRAAIVLSERLAIDAKAVRSILGDDTPMKATFVSSVRVSDLQG